MTMVTIDGKTDAVPEYSAWLAAFRTLDSGSNLGVPSVLEDVLTNPSNNCSCVKRSAS